MEPMAGDLNEIWKSLASNAIPDTRPLPPSIPIRCSACRDTGWVRHHVDVDHPDFGKFFACDQCPIAMARKLASLIARSRVPEHFQAFTFESFPDVPELRSARDAVQEWARSGSGSLYLHGNFGLGKTGLAVAAFTWRLKNWLIPGLFYSAPDLMAEIRSGYDRIIGMTAEQIIEAVRDATLLVVDDLGSERPTEWVSEQMVRIIGGRHDRDLATIFTSNYSPKELTEHFAGAGDQALRLVVRIEQMAKGNVIHVQGPDLRV